MDDLIRRQAAIDALCKAVDAKGTYDGEWLYTDEFCKAVNDLPSAQPQWIPCSEKLPEDDTLMLVNYIDERPNAMDIWIGWHEMENVWYIDGEAHSKEFGNEVVAWMPLPKPWKGEQDG